MARSRLVMLVEIAVLIALSVVLSFVTLFKMPQGGSVTAGSMVPLLMVGLRHGVKWGVYAGVVVGTIQFMFNSFYVHPVQLLLDYPIAFGVLGLAGLAKGRSNVVAACLGSLALFGRFVAHLLSGVIFFAEYAGGQNVWAYSAVYNASYMLPELIISAVLLALLMPVLRRAIPGSDQLAA